MQGWRRLIPEPPRDWYRWLRARVLSVGLWPRGSFSLQDEERRASEMMSIVVAVHDALEDTRRCLNSLEIFGGKAEVIIVDDGSKLESVKNTLDDYCSRNGWKLVRHVAPLGHSRASEAGVSVSTRPYVCLLNSDTVVTQHSWFGIARVFETTPLIAVVGPSTSYTPTPQTVWRAYYCCPFWSDGEIWRFSEKYVAKHKQEPVVDLPWVGGFAFFVRRSIWDKLGGFDKNLPDYGNEMELCRRLTQNGLRIVWSKACYIHHFGGASYGKTLGYKAISERCQQADSYIQKKLGDRLLHNSHG